jgi:hypothetical protein
MDFSHFFVLFNSGDTFQLVLFPVLHYDESTNNGGSEAFSE